MPLTIRSSRPGRVRVRPLDHPSRSTGAARGSSADVESAGPGLLTTSMVVVSYLGMVLAATFPAVTTFQSRLACEATDPTMHLWLMRWARTCLLEGRSPFFCPEVNYPVGVPLGFYPTMHLPTVFYLILSRLFSSDTICYNLMWLGGIVATGVGAFLLAWRFVRDRGAAWVAGLSAMLCGPMLLHAHGHLELVQMWSLPAFLVAWLGFVDRPGVGRLSGAVLLLLLLTMSAPYFLILAVFPAGWYVAWAWWQAGPGSRRDWLTARVGWLVGFAFATLPGLVLLFSGHLWAVWHGYELTRPKNQFLSFNAPLWGYLLPTPENALGKILAPTGYGWGTFNGKAIETSSYLGIVAIGLLLYTALRRVRFPRAGYWWTALALMVVLSMGGRAILGGVKIPLPAGWLWSIFPPFRLIRVPARFNLFVAIVAAVPVAAGLADILGRIASRRVRRIVCAGLAMATFADLAMIPFPTQPLRPLPSYYVTLTSRTDHPALLDAPVFTANEILPSTALWGYWQNLHGGSTTAAYSSHPNWIFDALIVEPSPWSGRRLEDPDYLRDPQSESFGAARGVSFLDYSWLYLTVHRFDYVLLHQGPTFEKRFGAGESRLKVLLEPSKSYEDSDVAIYDRARLSPPTRPTWLCTDGWRPVFGRSESQSFGMLRHARVLLYIPPGNGASTVLRLVDASGYVHRRVVRLVEGEQELARWTIDPGPPRTFETGTLRFGAGMHELRLESDGDDRPEPYSDRLDYARTPYSIRLNAVNVRVAD